MKFKKIYIELSDICGLKCDFCPSKKNERGIMNVENFAKLCKEICNKAELFTFHLLGDPLILENLEQYLELALKNNMKLELTTSGFYLNNKNQNLLLQYPNIYQINFSLMAFLSNQKLSTEEYFNPILELCKQHLKKELKSFINLRLWNLNQNCIPPQENFQIYSLLEKHFKLHIKINLSKNRLARHIFLHQAKLFKWVDLKNKEQNTKGTCHALKEQIGILSNGSLVPCCLDTKADILLGNVFKSPFAELLNSKRFQAMKEGFSKGQRIETLCQKCEFYKTKNMPKLNTF